MRILAYIFIFYSAMPLMAASTCEEMNSLFSLYFGLSPAQSYTLLKNVPSEIKNDQNILRLMQSLPPMSRFTLEKMIVGRQAKEVERTLKFILTMNQNSFRLLTQKSELTADESLALSIIVEQHWQSFYWYRVKKNIGQAIDRFRPSSFIKRMYERRNDKISDTTTMEDFLKNLRINEYDTIARMVMVSNSSRQIAEFLEKKKNESNSLTEQNKIDVFLTILREVENDWSLASSQYANYKEPWHLWFWGTVIPHWQEKTARGVENVSLSIVSGIILVWVLQTVAHFDDDEYQPKEYPNKNFRPIAPSENLLKENDKKEIEKKLKEGVSFEKLFDN